MRVCTTATTCTASTIPSSPETYGIYLVNEGNSNLTNTGTIRVFGDSAYELYVTGGTTTIVDTYNVTLDGNPQQASIYVANGATLALNNAALTVTDVPGETLWNTEYQLFTGDSGSAVEGNFGSVTAVNPDVTAQYYTLGTANAADDTVALTYAPEVSETLASASVEKRMVAQSPHIINQHMTRELLYDMLPPDEDDSTDETAPGLSACQRGGGAFLAPHYSYMGKDNDPLGYNASLSGVSGGYTQCVNDSLLGLHVGYGRSNIDYTGLGYNANTEDQDVVTSGFSGITRWKPWIVRYGFSGFHGWHDYHGLTGLSLNEQESASYKSYGETDSWQSVAGAFPVRVEDQQDETAIALATGVVFRGVRTAVTLSYDGEYSSDIDLHNFWMRFKLRF